MLIPLSQMIQLSKSLAGWRKPDPSAILAGCSLIGLCWTNPGFRHQLTQTKIPLNGNRYSKWGRKKLIQGVL
ncbi:hypothetical protein BDW59DRAFT_139097 [Aspergillus cavernicola]|uniref:Uncharacterized protein n=1 Tax=Aspergillus cavernicola TaxID=176166 RepID=A0ABR4IZ26_9EURO